MKDEHNERFPSYLPFYYRIFLKLRKLYRQTMLRLAEGAAQRKGSVGIFSDGNVYCPELKEWPISNPKHAINKSVIWIDEDMMQSEIKAVADKIEALKRELRVKGLYFSSSAANFISRMYTPSSERRKLWENAWIIYHSGVKSGNKVLDIGGASTAFAFYLASIGCSVAVVDNDWGNCGTLYNSKYVAKKMGWDLKAYDRDITKPLPFPANYFDRVFSICTIEHLSSNVRRFMMKEVSRVLKSGGIVGLSMDYDHKRKVLLTDKGLRFAYRDKLEEDVIRPSGLNIYGNTDLIDIYSEEDFLGALFLKKNQA